MHYTKTQHVVLLRPTHAQPGFIVRRSPASGYNHLDIRKISPDGTDIGCIATINKFGYISRYGTSWRTYLNYDLIDEEGLRELIRKKLHEIQFLFEKL